MTANPQDLGLREQAARVADGTLKPVELVAAALDRERRRGIPLNAACSTFRGDLDAELAHVGRGPLYGVPVGVKDAIALPWRAPHDGTRLPARAIGATASGVARRLRASGALAVIVTNMHQLGIGTTGHISAYGPTRNPVDPTRCAGGSSGGSAAAVAAGIVAGAVGTDAGGSVRVPAAYCGVVGLKPTWGAVPMDGCTGWHSSVGVAGPLARDAGDCRVLAEALMGRRLDPVPADALRVAAVRPFWDDLDPELEQSCRAALALLAGDGEPPVPALADAEHVAAAVMVANGTERLPMQTAEWRRTVLPTLHPTVRGILAAREAVDAGSLQRVLRYRTLLRRRLAELFEQADVLVWPTVPAPAPPLDRPRVTLPSGTVAADLANLRSVGLANLTGIPAITVPCGTTRSGLPVGLMLHARWGREDVLLSAAERLEQLADRAGTATDNRPRSVVP